MSCHSRKNSSNQMDCMRHLLHSAIEPITRHWHSNIRPYETVGTEIYRTVRVQCHAPNSALCNETERLGRSLPSARKLDESSRYFAHPHDARIK